MRGCEGTPERTAAAVVLNRRVFPSSKHRPTERVQFLRLCPSGLGEGRKRLGANGFRRPRPQPDERPSRRKAVRWAKPHSRCQHRTGRGDDQSFVADVPELPGRAADGASYQGAVANVEVVIWAWIETAQQLGRPIPTPRGRLMYT